MDLTVNQVEILDDGFMSDCVDCRRFSDEPGFDCDSSKRDPSLRERAERHRRI